MTSEYFATLSYGHRRSNHSAMARPSKNRINHTYMHTHTHTLRLVVELVYDTTWLLRGVMAKWLARWPQQWVVEGVPEMKQFAHNWYLPCCHCTATCSHVSSIYVSYICGNIIYLYISYILHVCALHNEAGCYWDGNEVHVLHNKLFVG